MLQCVDVYDDVFCCLFVRDGEIDIDAGNDADLGDLLDHILGAVQVDNTLVDAHLEAIPGLGTFTTGSLTGGDAKSLGGESDRALNIDLVVLCGASELLTDLFEGLNQCGC